MKKYFYNFLTDLDISTIDRDILSRKTRQALLERFQTLHIPNKEVECLRECLSPEYVDVNLTFRIYKK